MKPSNILINYDKGEDRFSEVELADLGGTVSIDSEFAKNGMLTGTSLFRAPEIHLEISWGTTADIWSFGVTVSEPLTIQSLGLKLIFHIAYKPHLGSQLPHIRARRAGKPRVV